MATRGAAAPPATPQTRLQVLDPFIAALQRTLDDPAREGRGEAPVCLRVSGRDVTVDPWTSEMLDPQYRAANPLLSDCCRVVTQSVALLAKCAKDLAVLEEQSVGSTGSLYSARAELMLDAAIGGSLVKDVQRLIDDLLQEGHRDEAGNLSKFHHQLRHTVYDLRKQVSPEHRSTVETLADQLSECPPEEEQPEEETAPVAEPAPMPRRPLPGVSFPTASRRPRLSKEEAEAIAAMMNGDEAPRRGLVPSHTAVLVVLLIFTAFVLLASRPAGSRSDALAVEAVVIDPSFQGMVNSIEDRKQSLYVTVDGAAWNRLDKERSLGFVQELRDSLPTARYSGLLVRTAGNRPVAQWLRATGASLLDDRAEDTVPSAPTD